MFLNFCTVSDLEGFYLNVNEIGNNFGFLTLVKGFDFFLSPNHYINDLCGGIGWAKGVGDT